MKKKFIEEKVFGSYCYLVWDCKEEEFFSYINKKYKLNLKVEEQSGLFISLYKKNEKIAYIWITNKKDVITLSHETIHLIRYWLQDSIGTNLNEETEETYCYLHDFYLKSFLKFL